MFPVRLSPLLEWISLHAIGSYKRFQNQIIADTISNYVSTVQSVHVDRGLSIEVFQDETLCIVWWGSVVPCKNHMI
jgi:hypothetical protein